MAKKEKPLEPVVPILDQEERKKALDTALKNIEKTYGKGAVMRLGDSAQKNVDVISTSSLSIDMALGIGGIPKGRITEIYGPESSGKTTLALHIIAECQKAGGNAAFIDAEHALDPIYAANLGVDIDNLLISQPDSGEQALEIVEALVRSGAVDMIVVDSVAALVPQAEIDGDMGQSQVGLHARLMSQAMRKLTGLISRSRTVAVFINQIREKVGTQYGNPETTTGGRALKFYATIRLDVRKNGDSLKQGTEFIGNHTKVKVVKNKVAPPFKTCEFDIMFGEGVSREGCVIDMAVDFDIMHKSGSWYSYNGERLGQGRDKIKEIVKANRALYDELSEKVLAKIKEQNEEAKRKADEKLAEATAKAEKIVAASQENKNDDGGAADADEKA